MLSPSSASERESVEGLVGSECGAGGGSLHAPARRVIAAASTIRPAAATRLGALQHLNCVFIAVLWMKWEYANSGSDRNPRMGLCQPHQTIEVRARSLEELYIANWLFLNSVNHQYEAP